MEEKYFNLFSMVFLYTFLLLYFKPSLILSKTITTGGDTASHFFPLFYLKNYLLPKGRIIGWCPGWFAGFPIFQFYFFPLFLLGSLLGKFIPLEISFKLITLVGTFLLPLTTFLMFKLLRFDFPIPLLSSFLILIFLFNTGNSMWGGNIPSTLAGEFSYSFSLSLTVLSIGLLYKGINEGKHLILNSLIFTLILLTHIYTFLFLTLLLIPFFLKRKKKTIFYLLHLYLLTFLLSSFWMLPFIFKMEYTSPYKLKWIFRDWFDEIFPEIFYPFIPFFIFGIFLAFKKKDKRILLFIWGILISYILFNISPLFYLVDIRFLPILQLQLLFISSYTLGELIKKNCKYDVLIVLLLFILLWVKKNASYIPFWIEWNYSGFENKELWSTFVKINNFLKGNFSSPRVMYEHSMFHDKIGTPRAFESLPYFAGRSTLEGLYMQSSPTSPFIFYLQSEISLRGSCPYYLEWECTSFNSTRAAKHLRIFNVKEVVVVSEEVKDSLKKDKNYQLIKEFYPYEIFEVKNNEDKYTIVPRYEPIAMETKNWKRVSYEWFKNESLTDIPLVFTENKEDFKLFAKSLDEIKKVELNVSCEIEENVKEEEIMIATNCIKLPHIVRISYFPNWRIEGAKKIYLVSPSFMLFFPERKTIRIRFEETLIDFIGKVLSYLGVLVIFLHSIFNQKFRSLKKR